MEHVINDVVYKRLAPNILIELNRANPVKEDTGRRKVKYHSLLTEEIGIPALAELLSVLWL
ncbi:MAG: P63C domain-containing protein [Segetibacter sp.]